MTPVPRYSVFAGEYYYPAGGACDLKLRTDSLERAESCRKKASEDGWAHIYDNKAGAILPS